VRLEEGVREIRDALDQRVPGPGEVDLRYASPSRSPAATPRRSWGGDRQRPVREGALAALLPRWASPPPTTLRGAVLAAEMLTTRTACGPFNQADVSPARWRLEREMVEAIEQGLPPDRRPQGVRRVQEGAGGSLPRLVVTALYADGASGIARS